jgi:hypothetical protein
MLRSACGRGIGFHRLVSQEVCQHSLDALFAFPHAGYGSDCLRRLLIGCLIGATIHGLINEKNWAGGICEVNHCNNMEASGNKEHVQSVAKGGECPISPPAQAKK